MGKKLLFKSLVYTFIICMYIGLYVNPVGVTAVDFPAIKVVPESIWNDTLLPGDTVNISITTDYNGSDICAYQFTISWNPSVLSAGENLTEAWIGNGVNPFFTLTNLPILLGSLSVYVDGELQVDGVNYTYIPQGHPMGDGLIFFYAGAPADGAEVRAYYLYGVVNGDLVTKDKNSTAYFELGLFNNTSGMSGPTKAFYFYMSPNEPYVTSGPGILANITFTVVGYGFSDLILGIDTYLKGYDSGEYVIIDAQTQPGHIQHGFFCNIPPRNDVAVTGLVVQTFGTVEQPVPISVTVKNEGTFDEDVTLTVKNNSAVIGTKAFTLEKGSNTTKSFNWYTSGLSAGSYTINATATISSDDEPGDNSANQSVTLSIVNDVAVTGLVVQTFGTVEQPVPINVTVKNEGSYAEDVTLTVYNETTVIDTVLFSLAKGPTFNTSSFSWNTSGIAEATYTINATATITVDNDLSDNNKTRQIVMQKIHDVAVVNIEVPRRINVNDTMPINVTVKNIGSYTETFNVTAKYDDTALVLPNGKNYTTVTDLACTENTTILFTWNTTGVAPSFYTITAVAGLSNTDTWTGDGANTTFSTSGRPVLEDSEKVYVDGTLMTKPANYTISYYVGQIEFETAPSGGAQIKVTYTSALVNETYVSDNTKFAPWDVLVTISGDVDGDGAVGTSDLIVFSEAYGSEPGDPNWNPYCDLNGDDKVDVSDLFDLSKNHGKTV